MFQLNWLHCKLIGDNYSKKQIIMEKVILKGVIYLHVTLCSVCSK